MPSESRQNEPDSFRFCRMKLLELIRAIERHRQQPRGRGYSNWFVGRTNDIERWKQAYPRRARSPSLFIVRANSAADAEAVAVHFEKLGMIGDEFENERRGKDVYVYYQHPRYGLQAR